MGRKRADFSVQDFWRAVLSMLPDFVLCVRDYDGKDQGDAGLGVSAQGPDDCCSLDPP